MYDKKIMGLLITTDMAPRRKFDPTKHTRNAQGKLVSKGRSQASKANPWVEAVAKARKELGITGFAPVKKGTPLYEKARELYAKKAS